MEKICEQCGSLVSGDVKFCPVCGAYMPGAVDLGKPGVIPSTQQNYQPSENNIDRNLGYSAPQYGRNIAPGAQEQKMTTGEWLVTIFLCTSLGIVSLILNIVWGFDANSPEPKRSFCRAMLVFKIITSVLSIMLMILIFGVVGDDIISFLEAI